jgi:hypothetical protein
MSEQVNHPAHYGGADDPYEAAWYVQREIERLSKGATP